MISEISLIYNQNKKEALEVVDVLQNLFKKKGIKLNEVITRDTELAVCVGGDGTVLKAARKVVGYKIPVACINVGTLGFLGLDIDDKNLEKFVEALIKENFQIEKRVTLEARVGNETFKALNDMVIKNGDTARVIELSVFINSQNLYNINGDGVIVSTPTGSTAYSFAASGPVVSPELELIIINPLNPHAINSRPFITGNSKVDIVCPRKEQECILTADGQQTKKLNPKDKVKIRISDDKLKLVKNSRNFINILTEKLNWKL
ncbi:MAG: NAD(+)/NADH kinase [Elusimicrobiota bacterium]